MLTNNLNVNYFKVIVLFLSLTMVQCGKKEKQEKPIEALNSVQKEEDVMKSIFHPLPGIVFDSLKIERFLNEYPEFKSFEKDYYDFYHQRNFNYAWFDKEGIIEQSQALYNHLKAENEDGIPVEIPYRENLENLLHAEGISVLDTLDRKLTETELLLTGEYFVYAKRKISGSGAQMAEKLQWYLPKKSIPYSELLEKVVEGREMDEVEDAVMQKQYKSLKQKLGDYKKMELADNFGDVELLPKRSVLKPGDSASNLIKLKEKLAARDFYQGKEISVAYNNELISSVNLFKATHGLKPDSLITNEMIAALNVPVSKRIEQLVVNIERFRWVPPSFSHDEFIIVNIPEFELHYFEDKQEVWNCNVVVGKPMTNTVIFSGEMQYLVMSPYWNIPASIINKEVKPGMQRDPNYLSKRNMEWNGGNVRQKPGPHNSLGRVKFIFPNSNNIYLHDTPAKSLFEEDSRAFSHGCIRVGEPRELAVRVLKQDPNWTTEKIDAAMNRSVETTVTLKKKIPVFIGYFTAFIDKDGNLNFRDDVYKRDARLLNMLTS